MLLPDVHHLRLEPPDLRIQVRLLLDLPVGRIVQVVFDSCLKLSRLVEFPVDWWILYVSFAWRSFSYKWI